MYLPFILAVRELRGHLELTQLMVEHMLMPLGQPFLHLMVQIDGGASANSILLNSVHGGGFMVPLHTTKGQHERGFDVAPAHSFDRYGNLDWWRFNVGDLDF
jgi:hypothetical protein